ncbi:hypothetical protein SARC_02119 [Sphaeroforma arctica JP610]|uniref:Uncharacterized protein n=1 Tax=Sphaeroforma arctica JP610 TaxID=667725 RepID=A0A0L0G9Y0_9EUKA|nr:hypothetical protein SARC_02119 [Sphaeroforma arctica JP610]KNC85709.1 hypothetical protein SARC_02119 [Sphaeroforma arctica JP610]|eukprot:XP_014159611.1 hypothetical protein SARC_02119 [Sphaeroforma arctica JP610]
MEVDIFLYQGTRAVQKTPWRHKMICRINPVGTTKWLTSETFKRKVEESKIPLLTPKSQREAGATHAPTVCITDVQSNPKDAKRNSSLAKAFCKKIRSDRETAYEAEAETKLLKQLMNDFPDVYDLVTQLMDKENISRIHTADLSGETGRDESSSPGDM